MGFGPSPLMTDTPAPAVLCEGRCQHTATQTCPVEWTRHRSVRAGAGRVRNAEGQCLEDQKPGRGQLPRQPCWAGLMWCSARNSGQPPQPVGKRTRRGPSSRHNSISMSLVLGSAGNHLDASFLPEPQFHLQDGCRDPDAACLAEALAGRADGGGVVATPLPTVPTAPPLLTMSSLPFLCRALDSATAVSTQAAKEQ